MKAAVVIFLTGTLLTFVSGGATGADKAVGKFSSVSPHVKQATDHGREAPTHEHSLIVGLQLRNGAAAQPLLAHAPNPPHPDYPPSHTPAPFNALNAPS